MLEQFLNHINSHSLCKKEERVLLAVSGGIDSMVMLHLFMEAGYSTGVAHCNFQLRGEESDGDEAFLKMQCEKLKVPFFVNHFNVETYAWENDLSTQMAARELRYTWFNEVLQDEKYDFVATAHHFNDSIETILLNWIHGVSLDGFSGIPVKNQQIIRPLLFALRADLEKYAKEKNLEWREDSSNLTDDYQRNFLRHQIVPSLKELNPSLESTIQYGVRKIEGEIKFIEDQLVEWKRNHVTEDNSFIRIGKKAIGLLSPAIIWRVLKVYGFNFSQCEDLLVAIKGQSGKKIISHTNQLTIDRDDIIITSVVHEWNDVFIEKDQLKASLGSFNLEVKVTTDLSHFDSKVALLDADSLTFPLIWRKWKPGDNFYPLGMEHKRKISDFLIDNKISLAEKDFVTVIESGGQIAWVVGYRIDNRFKIKDTTRSAISLSLQPYFT